MKIKKLISVLYKIGIMFWVMANVIILMNAPEWYAKYKYPDLSKTEPTRVFRRQFILSHATLADSSNWR